MHNLHVVKMDAYWDWFSGFWVLDLQLLLCDPERVFGYILSSNFLDKGIAKVWSTVMRSA